MTTMAQALMIRKLYVEGESSMMNIAEQVGVSETTVKRVIAMDDAEWDRFMAKREKHEKAPAKAAKKPEPEKAAKAPEPKKAEKAPEPAGDLPKCPKCGAAKANAMARYCWSCGQDMRSEREKAVTYLSKFAYALNKLLEGQGYGEM